MERIGIAGVSLHGTDVAGLERFLRPRPGEEARHARELADALGASELVFLATCNRVEVVYAREVGSPPEAADLDALAHHLHGASEQAAALRRDLVLRAGEEAARHLFRVAASLDSLVVGDDQIVTQVRGAYELAAAHGLVGPLLGALFQHAFAVAKQVRSQTDLARHPVSIVNLGLTWLGERPGCEGLRIAVLGAGQMGALVARALHAAGLGPALVVNRTPERARVLADDCGARVATLEAFVAGRHPVDALICATSAPGPVLGAGTLAALARATPCGGPLLAVDLAVPRDLEGGAPGVELVDLDALRAIAERNRARRAEAAAMGETLVERKLEVLRRRLGERLAADELAELRRASEELLAAELARLDEGRLGRLAPEDRRAVERWARAAFGRLAHLPIASLKRLAAEAASPDNGGLA